MARKTTTEKITEQEARLITVEASIEAAEQSQSVGTFGNSITRGNLTELYKERDRIEARLENLYNLDEGRNVKYARFDS